MRESTVIFICKHIGKAQVKNPGKILLTCLPFPRLFNSMILLCRLHIHGVNQSFLLIFPKQIHNGNVCQHLHGTRYYKPNHLHMIQNILETNFYAHSSTGETVSWNQCLRLPSDHCTYIHTSIDKLYMVINICTLHAYISYRIPT
jgi:hypothetical protein